MNGDVGLAVFNAVRHKHLFWLGHVLFISLVFTGCVS